MTIDLLSLKQTVERIARRKAYESHVELDFDSLVSLGLECLAELLYSSSDWISTDHVRSILIRKFTNRIIDERRKWKGAKKRGSGSHINSITDFHHSDEGSSDLDPDKDVFLTEDDFSSRRFDTLRLHAESQLVASYIISVRSISSDHSAVFTALSEIGHPNLLEVCRVTGLSRAKVRRISHDLKHIYLKLQALDE